MEDLKDEDLLEAIGESPDDITDEDLLQAVESMEQEEEGQTGGGSRKRKRKKDKEGIFQFLATPFRERTAKKYGIKRTSYRLRLANQDLPVGHPNIVRAFEQGLANTIATMIEGLPSYDRIQVYLGSNRLRSSHTSAHESVGQWRDPLGASRQILDNISRLLNSNENFEPDDSLQLDVTHISMPKPGCGKPKGSRKRWCFGTDNYGELLKNKRSLFRIKNKDDLCCARAQVVGKAMADGDAPSSSKIIKEPCKKHWRASCRRRRAFPRARVAWNRSNCLKLSCVIISLSSSLRNMNMPLCTRVRLVKNKYSF